MGGAFVKQQAILAAHLEKFRQMTLWHQVVTWSIGLLLACAAIWLLLGPAWAAIQLKYFEIENVPGGLSLQWATAAEYDLSGFEVLCKKTGELDDKYHVIGEVPAEGSPQEGATYIFPILEGLKRGESYCFRLREISINGEPGDIFDRCGWGLDIAPTPASTWVITNTATVLALEITGTAIAADIKATGNAAALATYDSLRATAAVTATPTLTTALQLAPTLTAIALISPTLTAIAQGPVLTPTSELDTMLPVSITLTAVSEAFAATQTAVVSASNGVPLDTPTPTPDFGLTGLEPFSITLTANSIEIAGTETAIFEFNNGLLITPTPTFTPVAGDSPLVPNQGQPAPPEPQIDPATGWTIDPATGWPIDPATGLPSTPTPMIDPATGWTIDPATGWPIDPATGLPSTPTPMIDPATGWTIDPATGWPIDPATGLPSTPTPMIDPATGWTIDPATGWPIDPATGLPSSPTPDPNAGGADQSLALAPSPADELVQDAADGPPAPSYIIQTMTPTPLGEIAPPTLTPLPAATATPAGFRLANLMTPNGQNFTFLLLCVTGVTAGGLGILGLLTSAVYMRSQRKRDDDDNRSSW